MGIPFFMYLLTLFPEHDYGMKHKLGVLHYAVQYVSQESYCYYFSGPENRNC